MKVLPRFQILKAGALLLLTLWIAFPKTYVHAWLEHQHGITFASAETTVSQKGAQDCNFESFSKPFSSFVAAVPLVVGPGVFSAVLRLHADSGTEFSLMYWKLPSRAPPSIA